MSDSPPSAEISQRKRRFGFSIIWLMPLIALGAVLFLYYKTEIEVGPTVTIRFEQGADLAIGAPVKYRGVKVGEVKSIELAEDLKSVEVTAQLGLSARNIARQNSRFWIVQAQVGLGQVSGLNTLMSGSYLQVAPGEGPKTTEFVGLDQAPVIQEEAQPFTVVLEADKAGSLTVGSPILYRGFQVGAIGDVTLDAKGTAVTAKAEIDAKYVDLVRTNTVFWNASGIKANLGTFGPSIDIGSLQTLVKGGISFATPGRPQDQAPEGHTFRLFENPPQALQDGATLTGLELVLTAETAGSVAPGDAILYRQVPVGKVLEVVLADDGAGVEMRILIEDPHTELVNANTVFWNASGVQADFSLANPTINVESLSSLVSGGIAFATQGEAGPAVARLHRFRLLSQRPKSLAPKPQVEDDGLHLVLMTESAKGISVEAPVLFREVKVGQVDSVTLEPDGVRVDVTVQAEHADLVNTSSVFWNASGLKVGLGSGSLIQVESLDALLIGGVAFASYGGPGDPVPDGTEFALLQDRPQPDTGPGMKDKIADLLADAKDVVANVKRITGNLAGRENLDNVDRTLAGLNYVMLRVEGSIDGLLGNLNAAAYNLMELSQRLRQNPSRALIGE